MVVLDMDIAKFTDIKNDEGDIIGHAKWRRA